MPESMPAPINDALASAGVPASIGDTLLQAISEGGYQLVTSGNTPVAMSGTAKAISSAPVDGRPGWFVHAITVASGDVRYVLEVAPSGGTPRQLVRL
jgi:hypothetical protein